MQWACAILSSVACLTLQYSSTLSQKRHDFLKKKLLNTECEFWFSIQLLSVTFLNLRNFEQDIIINMCIGLHVKYPLFLSDYNESWIFSTDFRKIMKYQISWKSVYLESTSSIRTDGWEDVWTDRQTDMTNLIVAFVNYVNIPYSINWLVVIKIYKIIYYPVRTGSLNKRFYPSSWKMLYIPELSRLVLLYCLFQNFQPEHRLSWFKFFVVLFGTFRRMLGFLQIRRWPLLFYIPSIIILISISKYIFLDCENVVK